MQGNIDVLGLNFELIQIFSVAGSQYFKRTLRQVFGQALHWICLGQVYFLLTLFVWEVGIVLATIILYVLPLSVRAILINYGSVDWWMSFYYTVAARVRQPVDCVLLHLIWVGLRVLGIYDTGSAWNSVEVDTPVVMTWLPVFVLGDVLVVDLLLLRRELLGNVLVRHYMFCSSLLFVFCSFGP